MLTKYVSSDHNFIVDQGPALNKSIIVVFEESNIMFCSKHLSTKPHTSHIFEFNLLTTKDEYDDKLEIVLLNIRDLQQRDRVRNLNHSTSRFYNNLQTMGKNRNNTAESINSNLSLCIKQDIYFLMIELYYKLF